MACSGFGCPNRSRPRARRRPARLRSRRDATWISGTGWLKLTAQADSCAPARRCGSSRSNPNHQGARQDHLHQLGARDSISWAGHVNYAASKGGVIQMMKSLAREMARRGIRLNGVAAIRTEINADVWSGPHAAERLLNLVPYGRLGEPEEWRGWPSGWPLIRPITSPVRPSSSTAARARFPRSRIARCLRIAWLVGAHRAAGWIT
jgi:NAD(P)-dependent dehydrogenase (short-subunit alcohol dehydrogenase family)